MAKPTSSDGEFNRDSYYTLDEFCKKIAIPMKTVRTKYVNTGKLNTAELARGREVIPGYEATRFFDELFGGDDGEKG